jgi:hypothetical protein
MGKCGGCEGMCCEDCMNTCEYCDKTRCTACENVDCEFASTKEIDGEDYCQGCAAMVLPMILKEITKLRKDNEELSMKNEDMAKLRKENEDLRTKLECKNSQSKDAS